MPCSTRREMITALGIGALLGPMVLGPAQADDAPGWPAQAFKQKSQQEAITALFGKPLETSDKINLDVPEIAENGAVVPVSVSTALPNVTAISILVPENPYALAASYVLPEGTAPAVACRLKMAKTSDVVAVVESDGKLYGTSKQVKVTLGGCGG